MQLRLTAIVLVALMAGPSAAAQDFARIARSNVARLSDTRSDQVRRAFLALQAGDSSGVVRLLDPSVQWQATRMREFADASALDYPGAIRFLDRMAAAIRTGSLKARLVSIQAQSDDVILIRSVFTRLDHDQMCGNIVRFREGRIVSVTDLPR